MSLPAASTSFVGREEELADAQRRLARARILTVAGPGGAGKTRFALELARRAESGYDEAFASFLAPLRDASLTLATIARSLAVRERPGQTAEEAISSHLEGRVALVLVDNLEHLPTAWTSLSALCEACPGLTLLATSREPLRVAGEVVYELPPLEEEEGVELYCERAPAEPSEPARTLCARLEGLPLAIELAAARTALLTPEQLLERLSLRLDLLKASGDADPRQQTLRATIQWSYDLLAPDAQAVFTRLGVFSGGCTLEAAGAVAGADAEVLDSLVEKNLLRRSDGRFRMLETIRELAADLLAASPDDEPTRAAHARHFLALAQESNARLQGPDQAEWLALLELEHDNLRGALHWFRAEADTNSECELIWALRRFWWMHGYAPEARAYAADALARAESVPDEQRAAVLLAYADFSRRVGEMEAALPAVEESLALRRRGSDRVGLGHTLVTAAGARADARDYEGAVRASDEARLVFEEVGHEHGQVNATLNKGSYARMGRLPEARPTLDAALVSYSQMEDAHGVALARYNLGLLALVEGRLPEAEEHFLESIRVAGGPRYESIAGGALTGLGATRSLRTPDKRAARLLGAGEGCLERAGTRLHPAEQPTHDEAVSAVRASLGRERCDVVLAEGRGLAFEEALAFGLDGVGDA